MSPSRAALTALLAAGLAGAAQAKAAPDYRLLATNQTNVWFLDAASIRRDGEVVSYDLLEVHHRHLPIGDRQPLFMILREQTRCEGRTQRETGRTLVDTRGAAVFTAATRSPWTSFLGDMGSAAFDFLCGGSPAADHGRSQGSNALKIAKAAAADLAARNAAPP